MLTQKEMLDILFQHTAARRRLVLNFLYFGFYPFCFNTQPPEGGWMSAPVWADDTPLVSTHSRPKAAGVI